METLLFTMDAQFPWTPLFPVFFNWNGFAKKKEENSNLDLIQRCLSFQDSEWSHRSKWKSRVEGGAARQGEVSLCVCVSDLCICVCVPPPASLAAEPTWVPGTVHGRKISCVSTRGQNSWGGDQIRIWEDSDQTLRGEMIPVCKKKIFKLSRIQML